VINVDNRVDDCAARAYGRRRWDILSFPKVVAAGLPETAEIRTRKTACWNEPGAARVLTDKRKIAPYPGTKRKLPRRIKNLRPERLSGRL
jgi:hypothetical protein